MVGLLPLSTSSAGTSPRICDSIFNRCDLPEPKKPEIHAPFCSWFDGSLYASRNLARLRQISSVSTYSLTSSLRFFSSLALITPLMLRSMSLLNSSLKLMPFSPFICVPSSLNEYLQILPLVMLQLTGHSFKPLCFQLHAHLTQILRTIVIVSRQTVEQRHDRS